MPKLEFPNYFIVNKIRLICPRKLGGFFFMLVTLGFFLTKKPGLKSLEF
jgi:hypothetical protein